MIQLRPHQIAAADAVENAFRAGVKRPLIDACVSAGKSLIFAELARREIARGGRVIIGAHTRELVQQNAKACRQLGLEVGINAEALGERCWRAPVISAGVQSIYRHAQSFGPITLLQIDECFPYDTLIKTPQGDVPIGRIRPGAVVHHALGIGVVQAVSRTEVVELVEVEFDDGSIVTCTPKHPLFTLQGWQTAGALAKGNAVFRFEDVRELRERLSPLDTAQFDGRNYPSNETGAMGQAAFLLNLLLEETRECDARSRGARENDRNSDCNRTSTKDTGREWSPSDRAASGFVGDPRRRVGVGTSGTHVQAERIRLSNSLQNRHCESQRSYCDRSGREFAQRQTRNARCEKDEFASIMGVARVSRIKLARPCAVYNLQVSGHPSYFANGYLVHNCHLIPHAEGGMYRELHRGLNLPRLVGGSGTVFRLQGGSLVEGEGAPFDRVVYTYSILDGIRDGYLCPAFSAPTDDNIDPTKLRVRQGEFTADSSDAQMIAAMDNHIAQMVHHGATRRAWLIFEAGTRAACAMAARMNEWGIPTEYVIASKSKADDHKRTAAIANLQAGRLRALVNVGTLTTGFDLPEVDMLVMRRPTKSLGLYIQMIGRLLRTIGGNITASIAAGKPDGLVLDFAGNIDRHGPLDFIRPRTTATRLVSCEECGKRNAKAAARCWSCDAIMTKNCPACLVPCARGVLDCPSCGFDMRKQDAAPSAPKLSDTPSGAALIQAWAKTKERQGGWLPITKIWDNGQTDVGMLPEALAKTGVTPRWLRLAPDGTVDAVLVANGSSRISARQIRADGSEIIVPMPAISS